MTQDQAKPVWTWPVILRLALAVVLITAVLQQHAGRWSALVGGPGWPGTGWGVAGARVCLYGLVLLVPAWGILFHRDWLCWITVAVDGSVAAAAMGFLLTPPRGLTSSPQGGVALLDVVLGPACAVVAVALVAEGVWLLWKLRRSSLGAVAAYLALAGLAAACGSGIAEELASGRP